jgi:hypothetical protein
MTQINSIEVGVIMMCVATVTLSLAQTPRIGTSGSKQAGATTGNSTRATQTVGTHPGTNAGAQTGISNQAVGITGAAAGLSGSSGTSTGATQTGANARAGTTTTASTTVPRQFIPAPTPLRRNFSTAGEPPRRYHRPRSPQLQLRPRRNRSDPLLAANSNRKDGRTQRRFGGRPCSASARPRPIPVDG